MNRKTTNILLLLTVIFLLVFGGCSLVNPEPTEPSKDTSTNEDAAISNTTASELESTTTSSTTTQTTESSADNISNLLGGTDGSSLPEEAQKPTEDPAYGFMWALDEESIANADNDPETIKEIVFDGSPITIYCQLKNGSSKSWEFGLFVDVEGVFQELEIDGTKTELYCFELQPLETRTVKMTFVPNIGRKVK